MADETEDFTTHWMRSISAKLDVILGDVAEIKTRVSRLKVQTASLHRFLADIRVTISEPSARMDRMDAHLLRIEHRLDVLEM